MRHRRTTRKAKASILLVFLILIAFGGLYSIMGDALFFAAPAIILLVVFLPKVLPVLINSVGYYRSEYFCVTHKPLFKLWFDKGAYGEYMIYRHLDKKIEGEHRWLFNAYIPRSENRTTEIDVILFHSSGVYIFESKNYKGWIFGTEAHRVWTQCIKASNDTRAHKYRFLNPIMQNKLHVACLKRLLTEEQAALPIHSIVLFGDRCKLKNIKLSGGKHHVITLEQLPATVEEIAAFTPYHSQYVLQSLYNLLYPMTQVSEDIKMKHIADINAEISTNENTVLNESDMKQLVSRELPDPLMTPDSQEASPQESAAVPSTEPLSIDVIDSFAQKPSLAEAFVAKIDRGEVCPRCGASLVLRQAKKGIHAGETFVGCSNFPKCRYTK
jgi:hypothetical protein